MNPMIIKLRWSSNVRWYSRVPIIIWIEGPHPLRKFNFSILEILKHQWCSLHNTKHRVFLVRISKNFGVQWVGLGIDVGLNRSADTSTWDQWTWFPLSTVREKYTANGKKDGRMKFRASFPAVTKNELISSLFNARLRSSVSFSFKVIIVDFKLGNFHHNLMLK